MRYLFFFCLIALVSCVTTTEKQDSVESENDRANRMLNEFYDDYVSRHPMQESSLGIKIHSDSWDDISDSAVLEEIDISLANLARLKKEVDYSQLDAQTRLSCELYEFIVNMESEGKPFIYHNYPITQMFGMHSEVPSFLANIHNIDTLTDAYAYLSRLDKVPTLFDQLIKNSTVRADKGIIPPKFVFARVLGDCKSIISGIPFDKGPDSSSIYQDFAQKISKFSVDKKIKDSLLTQCAEILKTKVGVSYQKLITHLTELEKKSTNEDGAWKFPDGKEFYNYALKRTTTTNLTAEQIFQTGEKEVARIHEEMRTIMKTVNYKGDLKSFFKYLKENKKFYYENTDEGRAQYLAKATSIIDSMRGQLDQFFITKPKADIVVKAVEPYREKTSAFAFYQEPAPDGSRPGTYYVSTYDMKSIPKYKMEALAYHEGIPGHHMQIALAQEMQGLPKFRKYGAYQYFMAYVEGWALYTEWLPKQSGFYKDPYSDFGRLSMEILRAARLVVDAGIHSKKWTREEAIRYFQENTPMSEFESAREIERYIVWPSQATAYKIGMMKIQDLRKSSQETMGAKFDQRKFHDLILLNGAVSLDLLEKTVKEWTKK